MKTTKEQDQQKQDAIKYLKGILKPGKKVHTVLKHVSSSGMSRRISVLVQTKEGIQNIDWHIEKITGYKRSDKGGIIMGGCGMDMGFALVYNLGRALYPNGFKLSKKQYGRNGDKSGFDKDGGYALKQEWL